MRPRFIATAIGLGFFAVGGCSLFVDVDGLDHGADAGTTSNDGSTDQQSSGDAGNNDSSTSDGSTLTYAATILADGPLAYFHFDEANGITAIDSSGNQHDGKYTNGFSLGNGGAFSGSGTSVHLEGSAFVAIDDSSDDAGTPFDFTNHQPFTLEIWASFDVQPVQDSTEFTFFSKEKNLGSGHYNGIDFFSEPGLVFQRENDPVDETEAHAPGLPNVLQWHYVVGVFDGSILTMYVDNIAVGTHDSSSTSIPITPVPFLIGAETTAGDNGILGLIDEAAIYDKALTIAQMTAHFHAAGF